MIDSFYSHIETIESKLESTIRIIKNSKSFFYYSFFIVIIATMTFFFTSKKLLPDDTPILNTASGQEIPFGESSSLTLMRWEYNEIENFMEAEVKVKNFANLLGKEIDIKAISRVNPSQKIPIDIKLKTNDLYVIKINNIPEKYHTMALKFKILGENVLRNEEASIYSDSRKVAINNKLKDKNSEEYIRNSIELEIKNIDKSIEEIEKEQRKNEEKIIVLSENISILDEEMNYQTNSEGAEILSNIQNFKSEEEDMYRKIEELENEIEDLNLKKEKLREKLADM